MGILKHSSHLVESNSSTGLAARINLTKNVSLIRQRHLPLGRLYSSADILIQPAGCQETGGKLLKFIQLEFIKTFLLDVCV